MTVDDGRALVQLNRPARRNCIRPEDVEELQRILSHVEEDEGIRVLVLTGTGPAFCAGYDLVSLAAGEARARGARGTKSLRGVHAFADLIDQLEICRVPTICGLNGPAYGGGCDLALACDFRLGVRGTSIAIPASRLGVHYYHGGLRRLVTRLGLGASKRLLLLGERIDAGEMVRIGYLDEVVSTPDALQKRIEVLAGLLADVSVPAILSGMKRDLNRIANGDMDSTVTDLAWATSVGSPAAAIAAAEQITNRRRSRVRRRT